MLTLSEQERIRPRLEPLANEQLLSLWDAVGITIPKDSSRADFLGLDQEFLIGPLFADTSYDELVRSLEALPA